MGYIDRREKQKYLSIIDNPNTSVEELLKIAAIADIDLSLALARSPHIPIVVLDYLIREHPHQDNLYIYYFSIYSHILDRQDLTTELIEILAGMFYSYEKTIVKQIKQHPQCSSFALETIDALKNYKYNLPLSFLETLMERFYDGYLRRARQEYIFQFITLNKNCSLEIFDRLIKLQCTSDYIVRKLPNYYDPTPFVPLRYIYQTILDNSKTPLAILKKIFKKISEEAKDPLAFEIILHKNCSKSLKKTILDRGLREKIIDILVNKYVSRTKDLVRYISVLDCSETLAFLAKSKYLASSSNPDYRTCLALANNPHTSADILNILAEINSNLDRFRNVREAIARNPQASSETLDLLSINSELYVRKNVARNANTSLKTLIELAGNINECKLVRCYAIANPNITVEFLRSQIDDARISIRVAVARSKKVDGITLLKLARDREDIVRSSVAKNPRTPLEILEILSNDKIDTVRRKVAENRQVPIVLLSKLQNDPCHSVRVAAKFNRFIAEFGK